MDLRRRLAENKGLHEIFAETVERYPNKTALIDIESGRYLTFTELDQEANKYANYFQVCINLI